MHLSPSAVCLVPCGLGPALMWSSPVLLREGGEREGGPVVGYEEVGDPSPKYCWYSMLEPK